MYCSRVTGQPSSKTSFVVVGADAGPSKLAAIQKHRLPTLDEDGFLNMIATRCAVVHVFLVFVAHLETSRKGFIDGKTLEKMEKEEAKIREAARELEKRETRADRDG